MGWLVNLIFTTLFSYLGWALGEPVDTALAVFLALAGLIVGYFVARRFLAWLDE